MVASFMRLFGVSEVLVRTQKEINLGGINNGKIQKDHGW
jgi:hypothetical protein